MRSRRVRLRDRLVTLLGTTFNCLLGAHEYCVGTRCLCDHHYRL